MTQSISLTRMQMMPRERENEAESVFEKLTKDSPKLVKDCIPIDKQDKHKEHQPPPPYPAFLYLTAGSPLDLLPRALHLGICFQGIQFKTAVFVKISFQVIWLKLVANTLHLPHLKKKNE